MTDTTAHLGRPHTIATAVACEIFDSVGGALRGIVPVLAMLKDEIMRSVCVRAQCRGTRSGALTFAAPNARVHAPCLLCAVPPRSVGHAATPLRTVPHANPSALWWLTDDARALRQLCFGSSSAALRETI